ncbi:MAG: chorismate--pyruvate lyase [Lachnospiraceae bacterium]|nr:chorismate--pyruvate lyase [Lachnospiraceae bacterium]
MFDKIYYTVLRIDGDYAYLLQDAHPEQESKCVARALLPENISENSKLVYEMMEYNLLG